MLRACGYKVSHFPETPKYDYVLEFWSTVYVETMSMDPPRHGVVRWGGDYRGGYLGSVAQISEHQYLSDLVAKDLDTFGRLRP